MVQLSRERETHELSGPLENVRTLRGGGEMVIFSFAWSPSRSFFHCIRMFNQQNYVTNCDVRFADDNADKQNRIGDCNCLDDWMGCDI